MNTANKNSSHLFDECAIAGSKTITEKYSSSFTLGIKTLDHNLQDAIFCIYGMVRYADEIVDTFHMHDKTQLLAEFREETFKAIRRKISTNPVLHAYQLVVNRYHIPDDLTEAFFDSMQMDLQPKAYYDKLYQQYIFGSAEVVGLMCLCVFVNGNLSEYEKLKPYAQRLGAAFQKVNFLRDMKSDYIERGRVYFPNVELTSFTNHDKKLIEQDIENDFAEAYKGILLLPYESRKGVYLAYRYYLTLFNKLKRADTQVVLSERLRVPNSVKLWLLSKTLLRAAINVF